MDPPEHSRGGLTRSQLRRGERWCVVVWCAVACAGRCELEGGRATARGGSAKERMFLYLAGRAGGRWSLETGCHLPVPGIRNQDAEGALKADRAGQRPISPIGDLASGHGRLCVCPAPSISGARHACGVAGLTECRPKPSRRAPAARVSAHLHLLPPPARAVRNRTSSHVARAPSHAHPPLVLGPDRPVPPNHAGRGGASPDAPSGHHTI